MAGTQQNSQMIARQDIARWLSVKNTLSCDQFLSNTTSVCLSGTTKTPKIHISRTASGDWLCVVGAWIHLGGIPSSDIDALLARYLLIGATAFAKELDGTFAMAIGNTSTGTVIIIVDPRGSMHTYSRIDSSGIAICTSSMALSNTGQLDPEGTYEFIATGIIYEDRSLWAGIKKLPPASITTISNGKIDTTFYWNFIDAFTETLPLHAAAESIAFNLSKTLKIINASFKPVVADLTGGYDSRLLLLGMLESNIPFDNTVVGGNLYPDVIVARQIADKLGLNLCVMPENETISTDEFQFAVSLGDGEINAFEYANIMRNQAPFISNHGASLNGSFGEVARGYWWELIWPKLNAREPLNATMLARKRFSALPFVELFNNRPVDSLADHLAGIIKRTVEPANGLPLTAQMDCVYLGMRMHRWQGRIASNTNQIWPAMAPFGMTAILTPMLAARPEARLRSLLPRHLFSQRNPTLASLTLEHGYPPATVNMGNLHRFFPVLQYYGHKVINKLKPKFAPASDIAPSTSAQQRYSDLFSTPLREILNSPKIFETQLFNESATSCFLDPAQPINGYRLAQWQRLLTLECTLRTHAAAIQRTTKYRETA